MDDLEIFFVQRKYCPVYSEVLEEDGVTQAWKDFKVFICIILPKVLHCGNTFKAILEIGLST